MRVLDDLPGWMRGALVRCCDVTLASLAWPLAFWIRGDFNASPLNISWIELLFVACAAAVVFSFLGVHRIMWRFATVGDLVRVAVGALMLAAVVTAIAFTVDRGVELPRAVPFVFALLVFVALFAVRATWMVRTRARTAAQVVDRCSELRPILLIGAGEEAVLAIRVLRSFAPAAVPVGILDDEGVGRVLEGVPVIGRLDELRAAIARLAVRGVRPARILVTSQKRVGEEVLQRLARIAYAERIPLDRFEQLLRLDCYLVLGERASLSATAHARREPIADRRLYFAVKRALDATLAAGALLFVAPLLGLAMLLVRLWLGPPVIFRQLRRGRGLVPFELLKLRTMHDPLAPDGSLLRDEERMHPLGRWLRRLRIDELPQLWNVIRGDMALVGPRPLLDRELLELPDRGRARALIRPGLTGWAQVNGGQLLSVREKEALDLWYIRHASLGLDLKILWLTAVMIVRGERVNGAEVARALAERGAEPALGVMA